MTIRSENDEQMINLLSAATQVRNTGAEVESSFGTSDQLEAVPSAAVDEENPSSGAEEDVPLTFPQRLMEILGNDELSEIIAWLSHGKGFIIYKKKKFASEVLPRYFKQSKFTSFTRKLNRWGFTRITRGPETGAYYHKFFQRGNMRLCLQMSCQSSKPNAQGTMSVSGPYQGNSGQFTSLSAVPSDILNLNMSGGSVMPSLGMMGGALPNPVEVTHQSQEIMRAQLEQLQMQLQLSQLQLQQQQQQMLMRQVLGQSNDQVMPNDLSAQENRNVVSNNLTANPSNIGDFLANGTNISLESLNFLQGLQKTKDSSTGLMGVGPVPLHSALGPDALGPQPPLLHLNNPMPSMDGMTPRPNAGNGRAWAA